MSGGAAAIRYMMLHVCGVYCLARLLELLWFMLDDAT